ncbi:TPA: alanyl-tRNA editing protein [Candidatus Woesearchaeota archaeon]|nr:alanyl-tRNA editing protein [Candidatus Woesearchaeota archaeon]HIH32535.1 alanyl-tRNA editing protein [Candidatus Woesearchaeota archaeon]HIH55089.1 alanyl-tRNA editing protein [Candidatus Woesearchaeota archaeon]HIJ01718.1 alanyl-tRNA editing protein [Candidatus Woesearchaeota archaeon]HIJ13242.1 alanyl-tRNA editing protein [Candidatus Woesearchaeota archaeon]
MQAMYTMDCYKRDFESKIVNVDDTGLWIELEETYFYPTSGGQPNDTGLLIDDSLEYLVEDVVKKDGKILHKVDKKGLVAGKLVRARIEWDKRYVLMRYHTASHILSTIINKETGAEITGNQLYADKARVDFSLEKFDRELMKSFQEKTNEIIEKNLTVSFKVLEREEAFKIPSLVKLRKQLPETISQIRIVDIGDFDHQACNGTHVKDTGEIGLIEIFNLENKGKDRRRIYFRLKHE